jgi:hypothetical protein
MGVERGIVPGNNLFDRRVLLGGIYGRPVQVFHPLFYILVNSPRHVSSSLTTKTAFFSFLKTPSLLASLVFHFAAQGTHFAPEKKNIAS